MCAIIHSRNISNLTDEIMDVAERHVNAIPGRFWVPLALPVLEVERLSRKALAEPVAPEPLALSKQRVRSADFMRSMKATLRAANSF